MRPQCLVYLGTTFTEASHAFLDAFTSVGMVAAVANLVSWRLHCIREVYLAAGGV
jgi:hypothetical protein